MNRKYNAFFNENSSEKNHVSHGSIIHGERKFELREIQQYIWLCAYKWIAWSNTKNRRDFMRDQILQWECAFSINFLYIYIYIVDCRNH